MKKDMIYVTYKVARRLKSCVMEVDTLSRMGGGELVILIVCFRSDSINISPQDAYR